MNILGYLYLNSPEINSLSYMLMSIHGASATLTMLYFHSPYREFCSRMFCRRFYNPKIDVSSSGLDMTVL
uniref:NADH:ubiquinone reductase (H(+)-translocating) n=1 Tax=Caenorhabditis tropicalis TaxID=1561998 RepID=A0A1I7UWP1_9PELO